MRTVWAFVGGALAGAALALLYAPTTGRHTRALMRDKAVHYAHEVQDFVESKGRHLRNVARGYTHRARELAGFAGDGGHHEAKA